jgi:hypothetical protein
MQGAAYELSPDAIEHLRKTFESYAKRSGPSVIYVCIFPMPDGVMEQALVARSHPLCLTSCSVWVPNEIPGRLPCCAVQWPPLVTI